MATVLTPRSVRKNATKKSFYKVDSKGKLATDKNGELIPLTEKHRSRTQQHFAKNTNINNIVDKYHRTGVLGNPDFARDVQPMFIDMSTVPDFQTAQNIIVKANEAFMRLKPEIRAKFSNDPQNLINFIDNPENEEEAIKLGLLPKPKYNNKTEEYEPTTRPVKEKAPTGAEGVSQPVENKSEA